MQAIQEFDGLTAAQFRDEVLPAGRPAVIRSWVHDWPVVEAGSESHEAFCAYLKRFDRGYDVNTAYGAPSIDGRLFYNEDLSGLNCRMGQAKLSSSLDYLLQHENDDPAPTLAIQSVAINRYLPGFDRENQLPRGFMPEQIAPRLWLGSRATIAAHYDPSENIACCVAGSRRFTLFPPEQVANLYVGPFEITPAGTTISMVDFDHPDYQCYPDFRLAEEAALQAVLHPGDAIYIPYLWWHHVRSLDTVNGLVNYWWSEGAKDLDDPTDVLMHAMVAMRSLPPNYRNAWRVMFEHYVFAPDKSAGEHLPADRRGILGTMKPDAIKRLRLALSRALSRS